MVKRWCSRSAYPAAAAAATAADEVEGPEAAAAPAKAKAGRRNGAPAAVGVVGGAVLSVAGGGVAVVACAVMHVACAMSTVTATREAGEHATVTDKFSRPVNLELIS